jgi:hypothetical protein
MQLDIFSKYESKECHNSAGVPVENFSHTDAGANAVQLDLFTSFKDADDILTERAIALLDALNDGRKKKDRFEPYAFQQINDLMLLVAKDKEGYIFNLVDLDGNTPPNFSVNWRSISHIKQDLKEHLPN